MACTHNLFIFDQLQSHWVPRLIRGQVVGLYKVFTISFLLGRMEPSGSCENCICLASCCQHTLAYFLLLVANILGIRRRVLQLLTP
jgi:hypothetical protein